MAREISRGSRPIRSRRLGGGLGAATHAVDLRTKNGQILRIVLKRFQEGQTKETDEWDRLKFAVRIPVVTPDPLAVDRSGKWFGTPAFAMTRVKGRPDVNPRNVQTWLRQIADALLRIHGTPTTRLPPLVGRFRALGEWKVPAGIKRTPLVDRSIEVAKSAVPKTLDSDRVIGHGDFHPGNLLWSRGQLTGVIDWSAAQLSLRSFELAYCRADLTLLLGFRWAEVFREIYEAELGSEVQDLWVWDLVCGLYAGHLGRHWVPAYIEQGASDLSRRHVNPRSSALLRNALAQGE